MNETKKKNILRYSLKRNAKCKVLSNNSILIGRNTQFRNNENDYHKFVED